MPVSQKCFAYKILKKQIGQQCKIYRDLRETGNLGGLQGMYVPNEEGRYIPADSTSAFLRGGIINTMACFEAYLHNLLDEASDLIVFQRNPNCSGICEECIQLKYEHVKSHKRDEPQRRTEADQRNNDHPQADQAARFGMYEEQDKIIETKAKVLFAGKSVNCKDIDEVYSFKFGRGKDTFIKELFSVGDLATLSPEQIKDQKKLELEYLKNRFKAERKKRREAMNGDILPTDIEEEELKQDKKQAIEKLKSEQENWKEDSHRRQQNKLKPMTYYYPINSNKISRMDFRSEDLLHMMLRFCYGIRCVMGHGNAKLTLEEYSLKNFPSCLNPCKSHNDDNGCNTAACCTCEPPQQATDTIKKLRKIEILNKHFNTCIKEQGKKRVMKTSRHFPRPEPLQKLENEQKNNAMTFLQNLFPALYRGNFIESRQEVLDENYALFHICRIHSYLKENERMMYITYRLLVRINQFILVLAHRMRIAVGRILIYKYDLPDGIWGVPRSTQGQIIKIEKFENGHREMVLNLLRPQFSLINRPALMPHQTNHCAMDTYNPPRANIMAAAVLVIIVGSICVILNLSILIKLYS